MKTIHSVSISTPNIIVKRRKARLEKARIEALVESSLRPGWLPRVTWEKIVRREKGKCLSCYLKIDYSTGASIHHLLPRSRGGSRTAKNLALMCPACHDKLEALVEAKLQVTNSPPNRYQLDGIFAPDEPTEGTENIMVNPISDKQKQCNAMRGLKTWKNPRLMLSIALREKRWLHVDWEYVKNHLVRVCETKQGPELILGHSRKPTA